MGVKPVRRKTAFTEEHKEEQTMNIKERLGKELLFLDGGMGTLLQEQGLEAGELPETWNIKYPDRVTNVHRRYYEAGSHVVLANTFGANACKFHDTDMTLEAVIKAGIENARKAGSKIGRETYVALDVGPTGKLLKPMGDLSFEEAYETFAEVVRYGVKYGADLIHIETMSDTYEVKAAVLAAKEHSELPVFVTMIFDEKGKLLTGGDVPSVVAMLEGLRVDAIGLNCGLGPEQALPILKEMRSYSSLPLIVKPNAGLPKQKDGQTYYDVEPEAFAETMQQIVAAGACVIGGCCGTTPEHIKKMTDLCAGCQVQPVEYKEDTMVSSYGKCVVLGDKPLIIGERINPTGKKRLKEALKTKDFDYILKEAITQQDKGAHILDVNVGLPDIDETEMMKEAVTQIQSVTNLPLQIDTVDAEAMEAAMRIYNGKPMINSVSGKQESMNQVFTLIQKYGGVVVGLTLDENGIPQTAEGRVEIAGKIIAEAEKYGIQKKDIVIDVLTMTISSEKDGAKVVFEALRQVRAKYGVRTVLGVSNISFGLPRRPIINSYFYAMAMQSGLSAGIINPSSTEMMQAYDSYVALMGYDDNCQTYIEKYAVADADKKPAEQKKTDMTLQYAIERGLKEEAYKLTKDMIGTKDPLDIIKEDLIPALNVVGDGFEKGTVFLPQLLMSADAAKIAFAVLKDVMSSSGEQEEKKDKIILATVKGDIHDIGKNIVKVLLENYGFDVLDMGKDVPPEAIVEKAISEDVRLVGLSALMTTTVVSMEETIRQLRREKPDCKVMVGGAVLNQDYADMIGADFYGKDAMQSVHYAQEFFGQ